MSSLLVDYTSLLVRLIDKILETIKVLGVNGHVHRQSIVLVLDGEVCIGKHHDFDGGERPSTRRIMQRSVIVKVEFVDGDLASFEQKRADLIIVILGRQVKRSCTRNLLNVRRRLSVQIDSLLDANHQFFDVVIGCEEVEC